MNLGALDRAVTILRAGAEVDDGRTLKPGDFAPLAGGANLPATYRPAPGTERFAGAGAEATVPSVFWIRWTPDLADLATGINPKDRLVDDSGWEHNITSAVEMGRREGIEILAVRKAD